MIHSLPKIAHSPTIENEVYESLFTTFSGLIVNLEYKEEALQNPDKEKLDFYSRVGCACWGVKRIWGKFTDKEIRDISEPISVLIKAFMKNHDYEAQKIIINDNKEYLNNFIKTYEKF